MTGWQYMGVAVNRCPAYDCYVWTNGEEVAFVGTWEYDGIVSDIPPRTSDVERCNIEDYGYDDVVELLDDWGVQAD